LADDSAPVKGPKHALRPTFDLDWVAGFHRDSDDVDDPDDFYE
jgi:hypothetical protein